MNIPNEHIPTKTSHFALLLCITFCVTDVITFCVESYYILRYYYILWQKLLHFALLLHFVSVITFCGVTAVFICRAEY